MSQPDSPTDFTHPALQSLDTLLRCLICREYYTAPLSISSCSHTFCAECLYSSLKVAKKCPSCRAEADEGRLKKNNALEDVVRGWKDARAALLALQAATARPPTPPSKPKPSRNRKASTSTAVVDDSASEYDDDAEDTKPRRSGRHTASAASGKGKQKQTEEDLAAESSDIEIIEVPSRKSKRPGNEVQDLQAPVECPVCQVMFTRVALETHIDRCSGGGKSKDAKREWGKFMGGSTASSSVGKKAKVVSATKPSSAKAVEKKLPLTAYDNLSLKQARALIANVGITTETTKDPKVYTRLHSQWVILWNSNCDLQPEDPQRKSKAQLLKELKKWEKLQDVEKPEIDTTAHAMQYEPEFRALIAAGRARQAAVRELVSNPLPPPRPTASASTAPTSEPVESPTPRAVLDDVAPIVPVQVDDDNLGDLDNSLSPTPSPTFLVPSIPRLSGTAIPTNVIKKRQRESSPFDPEGPKPSQRVREIEWDAEDDEGDTEGDSSREVGGGDVSMD